MGRHRIAHTWSGKRGKTSEPVFVNLLRSPGIDSQPQAADIGGMVGKQRGFLAIYGPMIYTAPYVMLLTRENP
jgi:hypothetical protein